MLGRQSHKTLKGSTGRRNSYAAWEFSDSVTSAGCSSRMAKTTKNEPGKPLCFGLSISNLGSTLASVSSDGRQGFQRSWERLRLETEQGKQLALNRERIAGLYSCKGARLVL